MSDDKSHTLEWMRRLDRRFSMLTDRFDQLEIRISRVENAAPPLAKDIGDIHQTLYQLDRRVERLENRFETSEADDG